MSVPPNAPGTPEGPQGQQPHYAPQNGGYAPQGQPPHAPQGYAPQGYAPQPGYGTPPQPPKKKGKGKFIVLGIVGLILILIVGNALGGGGDDDTAGEPAPSSTAKNDDSTSEEKSDEAKSDEKEAGEEAPAMPALGEAVTAGDLEFTLTGYECGVTVKDFSGEVEPQGKFCKIHVSVKNVGKSEAYLSSGDIKLLTEDGIEYSASDDTLFVDDVLLFESINPGNTVKGDLYFDIPEDAEPTKAAVGGGFLSKGEEIALS